MSDTGRRIDAVVERMADPLTSITDWLRTYAEYEEHMSIGQGIPRRLREAADHIETLRQLVHAVHTWADEWEPAALFEGDPNWMMRAESALSYRNAQSAGKDGE